MKWFVLPTLALSLSLLAGCGGLEGCSGAITVEPRSQFAGSYTATYTPVTGGGNPIRFAFTLDANGQAQGTVTDAGGTSAKTVSGQVGARRNGCDIDGTLANLTLLGDGPGSDSIGASRTTLNSITGSYGATLQGTSPYSTGTLTIARAAG